MTMKWTALAPGAEDYLGFIPSFLSDQDPDSAKAQIDKNYGHGGGWSPLPRWTFDSVNHSIKYPGDPKIFPVAETKLRDETIYVYESAWVTIVQPDGSFEVARID